MPPTKDKCDICEKIKILRFDTPRLSICTDCINIIKAKSYNEDFAKQTIKQIITETYKYVDKYDVEIEVNNLFNSKKNIFQKIIGIFFESPKEQEEKDKLISKILSERNGAIDKLRHNKYIDFIDKMSINEYKITHQEKEIIYCYKAIRKKLVTQNGEILKRPDENTWNSLKKYIITTDGFYCSKCQKNLNKIEHHLHHIIPIYQYGTNDINNLVLLCRNCHQKQHHDFKISKNINNSSKNSKIPSAADDKMIIICPYCNQKLRIICGKHLYVRCPKCFHEFEAIGDTDKIRYWIQV